GGPPRGGRPRQLGLGPAGRLLGLRRGSLGSGERLLGAREPGAELAGVAAPPGRGLAAEPCDLTLGGSAALRRLRGDPTQLGLGRSKLLQLASGIGRAWYLQPPRERRLDSHRGGLHGRECVAEARRAV